MKVAFLVSFSPMTRVVVDVEDTELSDQDWSKVVRAAREHIIENGIEDYIGGDTVDDITVDDAMPYSQKYDI